MTVLNMSLLLTENVFLKIEQDGDIRFYQNADYGVSRVSKELNKIHSQFIYSLFTNIHQPYDKHDDVFFTSCRLSEGTASLNN